jgi:hypothetical protein
MTKEMATVLYENTMSFGGSKILLDVLMVEHVSQGCIEIIVYNPSIKKEAPRLYVDLNLIKIKFSNSTEAHTFESAKVTSHSGKTESLNVIYYLTSRISVPNLRDNNQIIVQLMATTDYDIIQERYPNRLDIQYKCKPVNVAPYKTKREQSTRLIFPKFVI